MTSQKIILDCDPGHDDAIAILLAARSPALDLRAITVVAGNQTLEKTLNNALRVCEFAGIRNVPIAAGMSRPLVREQIVAGNIHGASGLDGPNLPPPTMEPVATHAVDLIIQEVLAAPDEIILVPVGPLTNIASALVREPGLVPRIKGIVLMGGGVTKGNTTPVAEFNIYADPEAAHVVFSSGIPLTMIGLDVTHQSIPDRKRPPAGSRCAQSGRGTGRRTAEFLRPDLPASVWICRSADSRCCRRSACDRSGHRPDPAHECRRRNTRHAYLWHDRLRCQRRHRTRAQRRCRS